MVELPAEAVRQFVAAHLSDPVDDGLLNLACAAFYDGWTTDEFDESDAAVCRRDMRPVVAAVVAAVRAEDVRGVAPNRVRQSGVIIVGARMTEDVLALVRDVENGLVLAVRAEERQAALADAERELAKSIEPMHREQAFLPVRGISWSNVQSVLRLAARSEASQERQANELLGYTVAVNRPSSRDPERWDIVGGVHTERGPAENHQAYCEASAEAKPEKYGADVRYEVVEVRRSEASQ